MSLAVTSSITWWFFRPLMAANMPRIMVRSTSFRVASGELRDEQLHEVVLAEQALRVDGRRRRRGRRGAARGGDAGHGARIVRGSGEDVDEQPAGQLDHGMDGLGRGDGFGEGARSRGGMA